MLNNRNRTNIIHNSGAIANYTYTGILNTGISYGNGVNTSQTFDGLLRLKTLNNGVTGLSSYTYSYDPVGNITSDSQKNYTYDTLYRLTQANNTQSGTLLESFNYDRVGNRNSNILGSVSSTYSGNILNQYLSVTQSGSATGSTVYTYDNNGNITNNGVYTFAYDYKNRLVRVKKVSDDSVVAEYGYDVLGRRVQKTTSSTKTNFVYAGENAIQETATNLSTSGAITTNRIFGIGTDNMLAYETDDTTLSDSNSDEYTFCSSKVIPSNSDFTKYGWTAIVSRCNDLQNQYTTTARKMFFVQKDHL
jgi:hypothetical protein